MPDNLADIVKDKFPGAYDHLDGDAIEQAIINKYPGAYDHLVTPPDDSNKSNLDQARAAFAQQHPTLDAITRMYNKDPSKEPTVLPDIKQPTTWTGGFLKSLYDQYVKPLSTVPSMAEALGGFAAGGMHDVPTAPTMKPSSSMEDVGRGSYGKANLPEFAPTTEKGWQPPPPINVMDNPATIHDPNYFRLSARDIYPSSTSSIGQEPIGNIYKRLDDAKQGLMDVNARQGLMSETGALGSGGPPKSEDYLQARQFFRDQGKEIPKNVQNKASDMKYDDSTGMFHATDAKGKPVGAFDEEGNPQETDVSSKQLPDQSTDYFTKAANASGMLAKNVLGFHLPGTAISAHGLNEVRRYTLGGGGPLGVPGRFADSMLDMINPGRANRTLESIPIQDMADAVNKHGLQLDISDVDVPSMFKGNNLFTKGINALTDPKPLFKQVIPNLKFKTYQNYMQDFQKRGLDENTSGKLAADFANNLAGGVTPEKMAADPNFRKLSRILTLAPDWMTSNYRLGKGTLNMLKNPLAPQNRAYLNMSTNFLGTYAAANALNYMNTGKLMFQNEPGKELSVAIGQDDKGKTRYFDPYGTAMDFVRLPLAITHAALSGDLGESFKLMRDRGSEPLQMFTDLASNTDYSGKPLYGRDRFGRRQIPPNEQAFNIGSDLLSHTTPISAQGVTNYLQDKASPEEAAAKLFQLPVNYKKPAIGWREGDE